VQSYNKIMLAADMFVEAHDRFANAKRPVDFIASLLLSGAVAGIVAPLLNEQGKRSAHQLLAALSNVVGEPSAGRTHEGIFRTVYNGLKHAGDPRRSVVPSTDLDLAADLRFEAAEMLNSAKEDFGKILVSAELNDQLSKRFIELLRSGDDYA
jgi:hypothetical protein